MAPMRKRTLHGATIFHCLSLDQVRCKSPISLMDLIFNPDYTKYLLPRKAVFSMAQAVSHPGFPPAAPGQGSPRLAQSSAIHPRPPLGLNVLSAS